MQVLISLAYSSHRDPSIQTGSQEQEEFRAPQIPGKSELLMFFLRGIASKTSDVLNFGGILIANHSTLNFIASVTSDVPSYPLTKPISG